MIATLPNICDWPLYVSRQTAEMIRRFKNCAILQGVAGAAKDGDIDRPPSVGARWSGSRKMGRQGPLARSFSKENSIRFRLVAGSTLAQVFGEEVLNQPPVFGRSKPYAAVAIASDNDEVRLHAGLLQRCGKRLALRNRHNVVFGAVHNEKRGGVSDRRR